MQNDTKKALDKFSEEDLRAVTGGCRTCVGLTSIALEQTEQALNNASRNLDSNRSATETQRAIRLHHLIREGQRTANEPVLQGCNHCNSANTFVRQVGKQIRK